MLQPFVYPYGEFDTYMRKNGLTNVSIGIYVQDYLGNISRAMYYGMMRKAEFIGPPVILREKRKTNLLAHTGRIHQSKPAWTNNVPKKEPPPLRRVEYNFIERQAPPVRIKTILYSGEAKGYLGCLSLRERTVLELRTGIWDGEPKTLTQVGKKLNVSRERIRQIEAKAIRRLRWMIQQSERRQWGNPFK